MRVRVYDRHIKAGKCRNASQCMIAHAIREIMPDLYQVRVRTNGIVVSFEEEDGGILRHYYMIPTVAARAIIAFDEGKPVQAFSFDSKLADAVRMTPEHRASNRDLQKRRQQAARKAGMTRAPLTHRPRVAGV